LIYFVILQLQAITEELPDKYLQLSRIHYRVNIFRSASTPDDSPNRQSFLL
jgi:hypothetical protein